SRLIAEGRCLTKEDLFDIQHKFGIRKNCVVIDASYEQTMVFGLCSQRQWMAFKGEDRPHFSHYLDGGVRVLRAYSSISVGDAGFGTVEQGRARCAVLYWSNPSVKDILQRLKTGAGLPWEIPNDVSEEYLRQMCSEAKKKIRNKKTGFVEYRWMVIGRRQN